MMPGRALLVACGAGAILSCSLVTDTSDLAGGARDGGDGGPRPFCTGVSSSSAFCDSFDAGDPPGFGWRGGAPSTTSGAVMRVRLDAPDAPTPPGYLEATLPSLGGAGCFGQAQLAKDLTSSGAAFSSLHLEFMARLDAADAGLGFVRLNLEPGGDSAASWQLDFSVKTDAVSESEGWTPPTGPTQYGALGTLSRHLVVGAWTQVSIDVTLTQPRVEVAFDGGRALSAPSATVTREFSPTIARLLLGPLTTTCGGPRGLRVDNVRFAVK
ncbi:MAG: hypothetical protein NVS3B10_15530 [Polyangiales bacterium]